MIKQDGTHRAIGGQIILNGAVIAVPGHHVQRAVAKGGFMKLAAPFDR